MSMDTMNYITGYTEGWEILPHLEYTKKYQFRFKSELLNLWGELNLALAKGKF